MRRRSIALLLVVTLAVGLAAVALPVLRTAPAAKAVRGLEVVPMEPDAKAALKAAGKSAPGFPNSANRGRKSNPTGQAIPALATGADQKVITLFVDFTTTPPGASGTRLDLATYFDDMLFGTVYDPPEYAAYPGHPTNNTLKNYYTNSSFGAVNVGTLNLPSTLGWLPSGHSYEYYCKADGVNDNGFGAYPTNVQGLVIDAIKAADPYVDFSKYAVDGKVPTLFVVFAGTGAEWSGAADIIWSHSWDLTEGTGMDGYVTDGVTINNYAMMPEVGGDLTGFSGVVSGPFPPTVGVYAHEYGHVLGLPDQYDYGYESEGTGIYSLMAGGSWNRFPNERLFSGNSPAVLDAWSKYRLGFVTPTVVTSASQVSLAPAETSPAAYKMVVPNSGGKEYYLFENRQQIGFDRGFGRYGAGTHGLAVYHVDDNVFTMDYWRPNEAENWKEFRSEGARKADNGATHYAISILQADDRWDLERGTNRGDAGDLYPGANGVTSIGSTTKPNTSAYYFWSGSAPKFGYSGVTVDSIAESAGNVSAKLSFVPWSGK